MRLFTRLTILFLSLAIIPIVIVANLFFYSAEKELTKEIHERLNIVAALNKDRLETFFASRKEDLKAVGGFLDVKTNLPTLQQFDKDRYNFAYMKAAGRLTDQLLAFMNSYQYADIMLLDSKGKVVFGIDPAHLREYRDKVIFTPEELAKAREDVWISDPLSKPDEHHPVVVFMTTAVNDADGKMCGYAVLVVDMQLVYGFLSNNTSVGKTGETYLVKKLPGGKYLHISPLKHDPDAVLKKELPALSLDEISENIDYRGEKVLSVFSSVPSLEWGIVTQIDMAEVLAPVVNMRVLFISISLVILLMIVFSSFVFARSIARPIHKLQKGVRIIGLGNLDHKVGMTTNDEVGQLSRTFDEMVNNLKKTMASRDELEKEVVKRQEVEEQLRSLSQELREMSVHDPLTGVLNRRGLGDILSTTVTMNKRVGLSVQVLLLDLDNFKQINDGYGHGIGDAILVAVSQKIHQTIRQTDYVARVGGDEFMVLLIDSREAEAVMVADKIRVAISQAMVTVPSGEDISATCSIGVVPLGDGPITIDGLLQKLHLALHLSKGQGKNRIAYQSKQGQVDLKTPDASAEFKKVLVEGKKFYAAFQPICNLKDKTKTGYELLSRLDYEGYHSPDTFLTFARNTDLLGIVDYACLKTCLNAIKSVPLARNVHINIFPSTLVEIPVDVLLQDLFCAGKDITYCLELNEQQILGDPLYLLPAIKQLRKEGVLIALDDYGFGRSSVETLILLEPDIVKIDKKIVWNISKEEHKRYSFQRLLRVIESCKARVIAEGIETEDDLKVLIDMGVTSGQGFLLGKPQIPPEITYPMI